MNVFIYKYKSQMICLCVSMGYRLKRSSVLKCILPTQEIQKLQIKNWSSYFKVI